MLQLDLQKAYDIIDWNIMEQVLHEICMPYTFIHWIKVAVTTVTYEFNINGNTSETMQARRGLSQGDPISLLLFVLMVEYFNRLLVKMQKNPYFNYHAKCEKIGLTNLTFADDIRLFCRGDILYVQMLLNIVKDFSNSTGLVINLKKCKVFCGGMDRNIKDPMIKTVEIAEGQLPMKYLGVLITCKRLSINHYMPLIDKITHRMKHWTSKLLSYVGRVLLMKSIMLAITQY